MSRTSRRERKAKDKQKESAKPIPLPLDAQEEILKGLSAIRGLTSSINSFVGGVRTGLGVPKDWVFDRNALVFRTPTPEEVLEKKKQDAKKEVK